MAPVFDGQPVDQAITNPAFLDAQVDDTAFGKITLANTDPLSGDMVSNIQENANNYIQNTKLFIGTFDNSAVAWSGTQLSFTSDLVVRFTDTGFITRVLSGNSPIGLTDGQSLYFSLSRTGNSNATPLVGTTIPTGKDIFRFATRIGTAIQFFDGTLLTSGNSSPIGKIGTALGPRVVEQLMGTVNGSNPTFTISFTPLGTNYLDVFLDGLFQYNPTHYTLSGYTITFTTPPDAYQDAYACYWRP